MAVLLACVALAAVFFYTQKSNDTFNLSKHYSYYEKFTYNDEIISENILSIQYGDYITNRYGVRCVQERITLQNFEGETLHSTRRLIAIDGNGIRSLCGYYIPNSNRYAFYNDKTIMPLGLIPQFPQNPLSIGQVINTIDITDDNTICKREVVSDQATQITNTNYNTKLILLQCDSPRFNYMLESYFDEKTRTVVLETERYINDNNTYSVYREIISAK